MARPLLAVASAFALGTPAGAALSPRSAAILLALATASLLAALGAARPRTGAGAILGAALALGAAGAAVEARAYDASPLRGWLAQHPDAGPVLVRGVCSADPRDSADRWVLTVDVEDVHAPPPGGPSPPRGRARIDVTGAATRPRLIEGDAVALWAELREPHRLGDPGAFDAVAQARRDGVHAVGWCKSPRLVVRPGRGDLGWLPSAAARAREWSRERLMAALPAGREQALVRAMTLGERTALDQETSETFRMAGTYHVLALSGTQVAMVAALLDWALRRLRATPLASALVVSLALAFYCAFVGGDVPVLRATVMAIVIVTGRALDLDGDAANLLGLAALGLLAQRPSSIGDIGFQLSFAATLALILLTPPIVRLLPALPLHAELALASSLGVQAALGPLMALHFHRLAPAALVLNLLAVPLSGAVLLAGFGVVLVSALAPFLLPAAVGLAWLAARALLLTGEVVRLLPWLDVRVATPSLGPALVGLAGLFAFARGRPGGLGWWAAATACLALGWGPRTSDGRLRITFLDVGQGDAIVVRTPSDRTWMVDTGGSFDGHFDVGETVLGPFLWQDGAPVVRGMVLSHAHPDHVGGVPFLLRAFDVREVWEGPAPRHDRVYDGLSVALQESRATRRSVARGLAATWDGVLVDVLGPSPPSRPPWPPWPASTRSSPGSCAWWGS